MQRRAFLITTLAGPPTEDLPFRQKQVMRDLIKALLPNPAVISPNLPSTGQITVLGQQARHIVHILYHPLTLRAPDIEIIEQPGLLENIKVSLRLARRPNAVALVPQKKPLPFKYEDGYAHLEVPRVNGHQAIVFE